jgi:exonuclease SbcD
MFRFIHAADIHLDSPLKGLEKYDGVPADEIRNAGRRALEGLVQLAIARQVAFVLLAGDIYDGDWRDYNTGLYFISQMARLREANVPVFLVTGNHDAANRMTRSLKLPTNVKIFDDGAPETFILDSIPAAVHGQSYATAAIREDLSQRYPLANRGLFNIGLLHTCASGREGHDPYCPCTVDGLRSKEYQYWALGHVHKRETLCDDPLIMFSGNLQGRYIPETGPKGCLLVTVSDDLSAAAQFVSLDAVRWEVANIDVSNTLGVDEILDQVADEFQKLRQNVDGRLLAVRVVLSGRSSAHAKLLAQRHHWINEIRSRAVDTSGGQIWVEKVLLGTTPSVTSTKTDAIADRPISEISSLIEELKQVPDRLAELGLDFESISRAVPGEIKENSEFNQFQDPAWLTSILDEAGFVLQNYLQSGDEKS